MVTAGGAEKSDGAKGGSADATAQQKRDEFAECVENINVLSLRLKNADERCQRLRCHLAQIRLSHRLQAVADALRWLVDTKQPGQINGRRDDGDHAAEHDYGVAAFNVNNMEQIQAIMEAAK